MAAGSITLILKNDEMTTTTTTTPMKRKQAAILQVWRQRTAETNFL
jgi:hypothetical protein